MKTTKNSIRKAFKLPLLVATALVLLAIAPGDRVEKRIESANDRFDRFCVQVDDAITGRESDIESPPIVLDRPLGRLAGVAACSRAAEEEPQEKHELPTKR